MYKYTAYGLSFDSELPLPHFERSSHSTADIDICLRKGVPSVGKLTYCGVGCHWQHEQWVMDLPSVAQYVVTRGRHIEIYADESASESDLVCFLLQVALSAALLQRGLLVLSASLVAYDDNKAFVLLNNDVGDRALSALHSRAFGWQLLSDGFVVLDSVTGQVSVNPGPAMTRLWKKECQQVDVDCEQLDRVRSSVNYYYVPVDRPEHVSYHLTHIFMNVPTRIKAAETVVKQGVSAFHVLQWHAVGMPWLAGMGVQRQHFKRLIHLANSVPIRRVFYRRDQAVTQVLQDLPDLLQQEVELV